MLYKTSGSEDCFIKVGRSIGGVSTWQRVKMWHGIPLWYVGQPIRDYDSMFWWRWSKP